MVSRPAILGRQRQTRGNKAARLRRCPRAQRESGRTRVRNDPATGSRMDGQPRHTEPRHRAHDRRHREVPRRVIRLGGRCPAGTGAEVRSPGTPRLGRSAWKGAPRAPAREKPRRTRGRRFAGERGCVCSGSPFPFVFRAEAPLLLGRGQDLSQPLSADGSGHPGAALQGLGRDGGKVSRRAIRPQRMETVAVT